MTNKNSIEYLAYLLDKAKTNLKDKAIIFLGAGTSVSAGIPLTNVIVRHIRLKFYKNPLVKSHVINGKSDYYDLMALLTADERRDLFHFYVTREKVKLNVANVYLAQLLKEGYIDYIVTVNFDDLILKACTLFNFLPPVYDISNIKTITTTDIRTSSVIYLHGQYFGQWLLNNKEELNKVENEVLSFFNSIKTRRTWIIVGYSGNDGIFNKIKSLGSFSNELFWVKKEFDSEHDKHVLEFLNMPNINANSIEGYYADSFFLKLHAELSILDNKLSPPDVFYKPFTYLKSVMNNVSEINDNDELNKNVKSIIDNCNSRINKAISTYENDQTPEGFNQIVIDAILKKQFDDKTAFEFLDVSEKNNFTTANIILSKYFNDWGSTNTRIGKDKNDEKFYYDAIEKFKKANELNPDDDIVYSNWGLTLLELAELKKEENLYKESIAKLEKAVSLNPKNNYAYFNYGIALHFYAKLVSDEDLFKESFEKYKKATELDPKNASAYINWGNSISELGLLLEDEKLFIESIEKFKKAIELKPEDYNIYNNWGLSLLELARLREDYNLYNQSIEKLKKAIQLNPFKVSAYNNLGNVFYEMAKNKSDLKLFEESFDNYRLGLEIDKNNVELFFNWGVALKSLGDLTSDEKYYYESIEKYKLALKINPQDYQIYYNYSDTLQSLSELKKDNKFFEEALEIYEKVEELNSQEKYLYDSWASALINYSYLLDKDEGRKVLDMALEKSKKAFLLNKKDCYNLACCYALLNEKKNALKFLEMALKGKRVSINHIKEDLDWIRFREDEGFKCLLEKYKDV